MIVRELTGTLGAANAVVGPLSTDDADKVAVQVTGTFAGTISVQVSVDGVNYRDGAWTASNATSLNTQTVNTTGVGIFYITHCQKYVRLVMTAYTSGTATITASATRTNK